MRLSTLESKNYLYEGLNKSEFKSVKLWESAGYAIKEAQLTADQINQLFQNIEQSSTDSGSNRTMLGKGKDVAVEVNKAWKDLKDKIYNSKPMSNFAAEYDKAAEKLKQATGGDQGAMQYVQKYRDFAKEHPILQGAIYAAIIGAAGISGVGLGGAAALGLFKLVDQALQGKDIRSAMWSGVKTAGSAWAAGQVGKMMHGADQTPAGSPDPANSAMPLDSAYDTTSHMQYDYNGPGPTMDQIQGTPEFQQVYQHYINQGMNPVIAGRYASGAGKAALMRTLGTATNLAKESKYQSKKLSVLEVRAVIGSVVLAEGGVWDAVKSGAAGVAGAVADKAKTVGHNLTTKVTADKLQSAWKQAGSPTDSEEIKQVLTGAGADAGIIDKVYAELQIPTTPAVDGSTDDLFAQIRQLSPKQQQQILKMLQA